MHHALYIQAPARLKVKINLITIGLFAFVISTKVLSQEIPYGLSVDLSHSATLITDIMNQDSDEVHKSLAQESSYVYGGLPYAYGVPLSATHEYGESDSILRVAIEPGLMRFNWLGSSTVVPAVNKTNTSIYSRSQVFLNLWWQDSMTITSSRIPIGTEVSLLVSHSLHGSIYAENFQRFNANMNIDGNTTFYSHFQQYNSEFQTMDASSDANYYEAFYLRTRVGDTVTFNMALTLSGGMYTEVDSGNVLTGTAPNVYLDMNFYNSSRLGIKAADTNVNLNFASGRKYPGHAMSPEEVATRLSDLKIKRVDLDLNSRTARFVVDAIPGASYVLQKSNDLKTWNDIATPETPLNFGEMILSDSPGLEPSAFWRISATPL